MPAPKGRTVDGSALALAAIRSAVAGDVGQPTLAIEGGVLRGAEVGEGLDLGMRELQRRGDVSAGGESLCVVGADGVSKGDGVLFGHDGMGDEGWSERADGYSEK